MAPMEGSYAFWLLLAVELLGLISAVAARLGEGSRGEAWAQRLFLAMMGVVGVATIFSLGFGPQYWPTAGATLSLMVLITTWDFGRARQTTSW